MTPSDLAQLSFTAQGAQIDPGARMAGTQVLNFGYRHKFNDRWSLLVVGQDLNGGSRTESVYQGNGLRDRSRSDPNRTTVMVSLAYTFGRPAKREPDFDYEP